MSDPILIVGGDGAVGTQLRAALQGRPLLATSRRPQELQPGWLRFSAEDAADWAIPACDGAVLCFGSTTLKQCEDDPVGTSEVNVTATMTLAERLTESGAFVPACSTSQVFDGRLPPPPIEQPGNPTCEYARQKVTLEEGLKGHGAVLRMTKLLSSLSPLLSTWAESLRSGQPIQAFYSSSHGGGRRVWPADK